MLGIVMKMEQILVNAADIIQVFSVGSRWLNGNIKLTGIVGSILEGQRGLNWFRINSNNGYNI